MFSISQDHATYSLMVLPVSEVGGVVRPHHALGVLYCIGRVDVGPPLLQHRLGPLQDALGVSDVKCVPAEVRLEIVATSELYRKEH